MANQLLRLGNGGSTPHVLALIGYIQEGCAGNPIWLDTVGDLDAARLRSRRLASVIPGECFAFDQNIHQIVVSVVRSDSDSLGG